MPQSWPWGRQVPDKVYSNCISEQESWRYVLFHILSYNWIGYLYFKLTNIKVQINKKKKTTKTTATTTTSNNARSYRENAICLINVNKQKIYIKENKRSAPAIWTCIRIKWNVLEKCNRVDRNIVAGTRTLSAFLFL